MIIKYPGHLGNNLFQYALGRIIAEHRNEKLAPYGGRDREWFHNCTRPLPGKTPKGKKFEVRGHRIDLPKILDLPPEVQIVLNGFFHRIEYYRPHKKKILQWYDLPEIDWTPGEDDVAFHVRRSNYRQYMVPLQWYDVALDRIKEWDKLYVFGAPQDLDGKLRRHLAKYGPIYPGDGPYNSFRKLKRFKTVVHSQSTFCWWAMFLSQHVERVYIPITKNGYWGGPTHADQVDIVPDEPPNILIRQEDW